MWIFYLVVILLSVISNGLSTPVEHNIAKRQLPTDFFPYARPPTGVYAGGLGGMLGSQFGPPFLGPFNNPVRRNERIKEIFDFNRNIHRDAKKQTKNFRPISGSKKPKDIDPIDAFLEYYTLY